MLSKIQYLYKDIYELEKSYLNLIVDNTAKLLYSEWVRTPTSSEYREALAVFAECLRTMNIEYWVQDVNRLGRVDEQDLKWALQQLIPATAFSKLKKIARINADDSEKANFLLIVEQVQAEYPSEIELQQFESYREAAEWIWPIID